MATSKAFISVLMLLAMVCVASAAELPLSLDEVQVNDVKIQPNATNLLNIERGQEFEVEMHIRALADVKDVEIRAFISGYEYSTVEPISAQLGPYDFDANVTYVKKARLRLPDKVDEDNYKLRIVISDRNGAEIVSNYNLKIDLPRHLLKIEDVIFTPGQSVKAGTALITTVRVENKGKKDEKDVKVIVGIPELELYAAGYIDEIESGEEEESEELFIRLPKCAKPGLYTVTVGLDYNKGHSKALGAGKIEVLENENCRPEPAPTIILQTNATETNQTSLETTTKTGTSQVRAVLEIILIVLVALLVIVGLVIGFSRLREA